MLRLLHVPLMKRYLDDAEQVVVMRQVLLITVKLDEVCLNKSRQSSFEYKPSLIWIKSNFVYSELTVPNFFEESWRMDQCKCLNQTFSKQHLDWFNICWLANSPQELPFNIHTYGDTLEMVWYHRYEDLTHLWEGNIITTTLRWQSKHNSVFPSGNGT